MLDITVRWWFQLSLVPRLSRTHGRGEGKKESLVHTDCKFHHVRLLPPMLLCATIRNRIRNRLFQGRNYHLSSSNLTKMPPAPPSRVAKKCYSQASCSGVKTGFPAPPFSDVALVSSSIARNKVEKLSADCSLTLLLA